MAMGDMLAEVVANLSGTSPPTHFVWLYIKAPAVQLTTAISIGDTYHIKGKKCLALLLL